MLSDHIFPLRAFIPLELKQCAMEGRETASFSERIAALDHGDISENEKEQLAGELLDGLANAPLVDGYPYAEPVALQDILASRPAYGRGLSLNLDGLDHAQLYDKIYGAWLGRCAGCLLGHPVEFWHKERLVGLLKETDNYPIRHYISSNIHEELKTRFGVSDQGWSYGSSVTNWVNNISHMPEDDDINYTILALKVLEESGRGFIGGDVALRWLMDLPVLHTFTSERIAYRNFLNGVFPPASSCYRNPCREWIGAQIRGDFFGYINPGRPQAAAAMAYRDGTISHTKNGVYGEMFVSAMLTAAVAGGEPEGIIGCGLSQIPENCRLAEAVRTVLDWKKEGLDWEQAIERIHELYDEKDVFDSLYVVPNAMVVTAGLAYGEMDFEKSIGIAVTGSFDKDCNGATVGSVVGMVLGALALPQKWTAPLNDAVKSGIDGFGVIKISELAARTVKVANALITDGGVCLDS